MRGSWLMGCLACFAAFACGEEKKPPPVPIARVDGCDDRPDGIVCAEGAALTCASGDAVASDPCSDAGLICTPELGCAVCRPGYFDCEGNSLMRCNEDGSGRFLVEDCGDQLNCSATGCRDLCSEVLAERSYVGCEYWPVFTANSQLDDVFKPAVVVANSNLVEAVISIERGGTLVAETRVPPDSAETVMLDFVPSLKTPLGSVLERQGAYHLRSNVPVIVHQFNPLEFEADRDCIGPGPDDQLGDSSCNSYTNGASLLLPSHVLARASDHRVSYVGIARTSMMWLTGDSFVGLPGFLALVAVGTEPVTVQLRSSAHTLPTLDGLVPGLTPGQTAELMLEPGDVFQIASLVPSICPGEQGSTSREIVCDPGPDYDLTGTEIQADGPLQVIGGHDCSYVPFDRVACDHIEESIFPLETWGKRVIVSRPQQSASGRYRLRVVSGADGNQISFDPAVSEPIALDRGKWFEVETTEHVIVEGSKQLAVAQYLLGQGEVSRTGDPSLSLVAPVEQYRAQYNFLTPSTYVSNYVNVVSLLGETVLLDGESIDGFSPLGETGYQITTVRLERAGAHELHSQAATTLGVTLHGYGAYTSYILPGGLDLALIGEPLF